MDPKNPGETEEEDLETYLESVPEDLRPLHMLAFVASQELDKLKRQEKEEEKKNQSLRLPPYNLLPNVPHHQGLLEKLQSIAVGQMLHPLGKTEAGNELDEHQNRLILQDGQAVETALRELLTEEEMKMIKKEKGIKVIAVDRHGKVHGDNPRLPLILKQSESDGAFLIVGDGMSSLVESIGSKKLARCVHLWAGVVRQGRNNNDRQLLLAIVEESSQQRHESNEQEKDEEDGYVWVVPQWRPRARRSDILCRKRSDWKKLCFGNQ